jgi:prepilin-type N-terminal cleavage/methylation domain-containing protein
MTVLPRDPLYTSANPVSYGYRSSGPTYILVSKLENKSDPDIASSQARCPTTYGSYDGTKDASVDYSLRGITMQKGFTLIELLIVIAIMGSYRRGHH